MRSMRRCDTRLGQALIAVSVHRRMHQFADLRSVLVSNGGWLRYRVSMGSPGVEGSQAYGRHAGHHQTTGEQMTAEMPLAEKHSP